MNLTKAYVGAMTGLHCNNFILESRDVQLAICKQLALMRPRGIVNDGEFVSDYDMQGLKPVKGKKDLK